MSKGFECLPGTTQHHVIEHSLMLPGHYERVCSGEALKSARSDYQNVARSREIEAVLPKAWNALLEDPDSLLLDLLADKAEDLCGYKPDLDVCSKFLAHSLKYGGPIGHPLTHEPQRPSPQIPKQGKPYRKPRKRNVDNFSFIFAGKTYEAGSAREVMLKVFHQNYQNSAQTNACRGEFLVEENESDFHLKNGCFPFSPYKPRRYTITSFMFFIP